MGCFDTFSLAQALLSDHPCDRMLVLIDLKINMIINDLVDKRYGRLVVQGFSHVEKRGSSTRSIMDVICDCGAVKKVLRQQLIAGDTKSCGCLLRELRKVGIHKMSNTRFYRIFDHLNQRCNNPKSDHYLYYGGRNIKCLWNNFIEFRDDMYESYLEHVEEFGEKETTIDRIDNGGNYCKENCRWSTRKQQSRNLRNNVFLTCNGVTKTLPEWAEQKGIIYDTLFNRACRAGWNHCDAINKPVKKKAK